MPREITGFPTNELHLYFKMISDICSDPFVDKAIGENILTHSIECSQTGITGLVLYKTQDNLANGISIFIKKILFVTTGTFYINISPK